MELRRVRISALIILVLLPLCCRAGGQDERYAYLDNGKVRIGLDLSRGGGIFHFSTAAENINRLNHYDEGRFIQQSYYGNDGRAYKWGDNNWSWNPIQGGGSDGQPATVIEKEIGEDFIKVVTIPRQWGRLVSYGCCPIAADCTMTEVITLKDDYAILEFSFSYDGETDLGSTTQELPAFFCDWNFNRFVAYTGERPWTGDELTYITPIPLRGIANENPACNATEEWYAYVDENGYGIGLYTPGTGSAVYYTHGTGPGGADAGSCSYFAPIRKLHITAPFSFSYKAYLTIGNIDRIRDTFKAINTLSSQDMAKKDCQN